MPVFFQHQINDSTRIGIWKIEETEEFFKNNVPQHRDVTHPHKRLQHLAGRFLLQYLFPDFPYEMILIADTKKPYLKDEQFHFSISHCGDYAAAIVSRDSRVGVDIEIPVEKIHRLKKKYINEQEMEHWNVSLLNQDVQVATLIWSAKEAVFKWYGQERVDFKKHIQLQHQNEKDETLDCFFAKSQSRLIIHYRQFEHLILSWVLS